MLTMEKALFRVGIFILLNCTQCLCFQIYSSGIPRAINPGRVKACPCSRRVGHATKNDEYFVTRMGVRKEEETKDSGSETILWVFKKNPGTIIVVPFVILFGFDLIANIAVVTKRSLEVLFTGEYTTWTPWQ
eukprot:CCRYP_014327-RA/>CCRYP_014327-RA protein AED:0.43 eAED:0.43 QI:216/1/1/1/0/0/2/374/131